MRDLGDQALDRNAALDVECTNSGTHWTLTLGSGTDRDGEVVIDGRGLPPGITPPVIIQDAVWRTETLAGIGSPDQRQPLRSQIPVPDQIVPTYVRSKGVADLPEHDLEPIAPERNRALVERVERDVRLVQEEAVWTEVRLLAKSLVAALGRRWWDRRASLSRYCRS